MAQRTQHEPNAPPTFHLTHRYMEGLRFDGIWEYPVQTAAGRWRWKALPLLDAPSSSATRLDPQGAWWCVRQCAAVMAQARPTAKLLKGRAPCPETGQVVHALQASLPGCEVKAEESITCRAIDDLATMLERRGCALLQLEGKVHAADSSGVFWIWMVGTETQYGANSRRETALLVVGQHWPAPWSTGFGAKVFPHDDGRWKLCSVDGEVIQGRLTALITVKPMVAS